MKNLIASLIVCTASAAPFAATPADMLAPAKVAKVASATAPAVTPTKVTKNQKPSATVSKVANRNATATQTKATPAIK